MCSSCWLVCLCACACVGLSANTSMEMHVLSLSVIYGRGSILLWRRCDTLCTSGFMDDVTSAHNGRKYTTRQRRTVVVIQQVWQRGFNAATNTSTDPPGAALDRRGRSLISKIASSIHCAQFAMLCTDDGFRVRACRLCFTCIPNDVHTASARHLGITAFVFSQIL